MVLGSIDPLVLKTFQETAGLLDFTRCVRPDGSAYGTAGRCRKGVESPLKEQIAQTRSLYKDLKDLRAQKLPSGEEEWRAEEIEKRIYKVRKEALEKAQNFGKKGETALKEFEKASFEGYASALPKDRLENEIGRYTYDLNTYLGDKAEKGRVKDLEKKIRILISNIPNLTEKENALYELDLRVGKVKPSRPGTLNTTIKAGKAFLRRHEEGLKSAASILRKANFLEERLREESKRLQEEKPPGWIKQKLRVSSSIMKLAQRRGNAEQRLRAKMEGIRKELLQTNLSDAEINRLVGRVTLSSKGRSKKESRELEENTKSQLEEFARLFNGKGLTLVQDGSERRRQLSFMTLNPTVRAFAYGESGTVVTSGIKATLFHEVGHVVEAQRRWLADYSILWRDTRAFSREKAEASPQTRNLLSNGISSAVPVANKSQSGRAVPLYALDDLPPLKGKGYKKYEVAVVDTFVNPYIGKVYSDKLTEVVSMTVEHFSEPYLMAHLYKSHPDLFTIGVGLATTP